MGVTWGTIRSSALPAVLVTSSICLAGCSESDLGGPTADAIAERLDQECSPATREREQERGVEKSAEEAIVITCDAEIAPFAVLLRFSDHSSLVAATMRDAKARPEQRACVLRTESFTGSFLGFGDVCSHLGGSDLERLGDYNP